MQAAQYDGADKLGKPQKQPRYKTNVDSGVRFTLW